MNPGVTPEQKEFIVRTIQKYFPRAEMLFFGSRFTGQHKSHSDLDVCIRDQNPLSITEWSKLGEELSESDLPFKVDLLDWQRIGAEFRVTILKNHEEWG